MEKSSLRQCSGTGIFHWKTPHTHTLRALCFPAFDLPLKHVLFQTPHPRSSHSPQPWRKRINNRAPPSGAEHFHSNSRFGPRCLMLIPVNVCVLLVFLFFCFRFRVAETYSNPYWGKRGERRPITPAVRRWKGKKFKHTDWGMYGKGSMFYISSGL